MRDDLTPTSKQAYLYVCMCVWERGREWVYVYEEGQRKRREKLIEMWCLSFCRRVFVRIFLRLSEATHCCPSFPPWSVVFINRHRHLIQMAEHLKFKDTIFCAGKWTESTLYLTTWIWSWGGLWNKWCISNVWKCTETTENTWPSVNSVGSVYRDVMLYYEELCTLNKQLKQTSSMSVKWLTLFPWILTRREESEGKKKSKVSSLQTLMGNSEFCLSCLCQVHCVSVFPACPVCFTARQWKSV